MLTNTLLIGDLVGSAHGSLGQETLCKDLVTTPELFSFILRRINTRLDHPLSLSASQKTTNRPIISSSNGIQSKQCRLFIEMGLVKKICRFDKVRMEVEKMKGFVRRLIEIRVILKRCS